MWDCNFKTIISGGNSQPSFSEVNIYLDCSKMNGRVGAGYVLARENKFIYEESFRSPDTSTVCQAEVLALKLTAKKAYDIIEFGPIFLYSRFPSCN